ncbi:quaternary amine ABC transporter ATP-binding protein [Pararhizobium sp. DWP3-4]|uniref:quaternary amine ABC transporter ATP-binding protein n=1 Tax=Pararhizobium sp. DWP3-4 TaxID=2804565 RepID=UPI003CE73367
MTERLRIENLYKVFGGSPERAMSRLRSGSTKEKVLADTGLVVGLNNVSLSVPSGSIYMIMGLSGSGKSTLARCINRLNEPSAGKILLDGEDLVALGERQLREVRRTRISMVFQHFALLPNRTVTENVEFGLKLRGIPPAVRRRKAEEILSIVGLASWSHRLPHELSGGMRQRVGLARALATDADVLIMDEAFSALDPLIRAEMQEELLRLQRTFQKTILFITHDFQEALKLGTRIAIMADGELMREGEPQEIVLDPQSDYVTSFTKDVDRSRLFDARAAMRPGEVQTIRGSQFALCEYGAIALDSGNRVKGHIALKDIDRLRAGDDMSTLLSADFKTVPPDAKLLDVSRLYKSGRPLVVTDEDQRFIGTVCAESILSQIAALPTGSASARRNPNV